MSVKLFTKADLRDINHMIGNMLCLLPEHDPEYEFLLTVRENIRIKLGAESE